MEPQRIVESWASRRPPERRRGMDSEEPLTPANLEAAMRRVLAAAALRAAAAAQPTDLPNQKPQP